MAIYLSYSYQVSCSDIHFSRYWQGNKIVVLFCRLGKRVEKAKGGDHKDQLTGVQKMRRLLFRTLSQDGVFQRLMADNL